MYKHLSFLIFLLFLVACKEGQVPVEEQLEENEVEYVDNYVNLEVTSTLPCEP